MGSWNNSTFRPYFFLLETIVPGLSIDYPLKMGIANQFGSFSRDFHKPISISS